MNSRDSHFATLAFVVVLSLPAFAVTACGPRASATAGPATAQAGSEDPDDEKEAESDADTEAKEAPPTEEEVRAARDKADVDPFSQSDAEPKESAEPERDEKGHKKLKAPDSNREPLLKKPPAKPKAGSSRSP